MKTLFLSFFGLICLNSYGQGTFLGDQVFEVNKRETVFNFESYKALVRIGNIINTETKHAIVFQQIDSVNHFWQVKLFTYQASEIVEEIVDTLEVGIIVDVQLIDKNFDNNNDLLITIGSNKAIDFLYLFDDREDRLRPLRDFTDYPATKQVGTSKFLYSYKSSGCADNYWKSNLIRIEKFSIVQYGEIVGNGCDDSEHVMTVSTTGDKTLVLDLKLLEDFPNGKFDLIEKLWNQKVAEWGR